MPPRNPDWRKAQDYAWISKLPREAFAWEWLRRNAAYRDEALSVSAQPLRTVNTHHPYERWNLHGFEDPRLTALEARPMWAKKAYPYALGAWAMASRKDADAFVLETLKMHSRIAADDGVQHLLISDGLRSLRLDISGDRLESGPVRLRYELDGIEALARPLETLRRFKFMVEHGRLSERLHPVEPRARRMILLLRTFDGLRAGASQRDIAGILHGRPIETAGWRSDYPSLRAQAQRLASAAQAYSQGAFWQLLR